jgi:16S rRNA (uracil1498-N3)-methyltransferase
MHRFYVPPELCREEVFSLPPDEAHHAARVLRVRPGEPVTVLDGAGQRLIAAVEEVTNRSVRVRIATRETLPPPPCPVTLVQAIPKGKIIESILQKATELGVSRVIPVLSERVITHLEGDSAEAKGAKWQQIVVEAGKQSGNPWLPKVERPQSIRQCIARGPTAEFSLVACLETGSRHAREWFDAFAARHRRAPQSVSIWIGPEGDFSAAEYAQIKSTGALPITLGPLVLRVETAATYCLSVINHEITGRTMLPPDQETP